MRPTEEETEVFANYMSREPRSHPAAPPRGQSCFGSFRLLQEDLEKREGQGFGTCAVYRQSLVCNLEATEPCALSAMLWRSSLYGQAWSLSRDFSPPMTGLQWKASRPSNVEHTTCLVRDAMLSALDGSGTFEVSPTGRKHSRTCSRIRPR